MDKNKKIKIGEDKVIEYYEKGFKDTSQVFESISEERLENFINNLSKLSEEDVKLMYSAFPSKGKRLYLEVVVEDSYLGSKVFDWLYHKSNLDNSDGLSVFGLKLESIFYKKPSGYSEEEKRAIKELYQKAFGNE